jgi:hypothetical protein
MRGSKSRPGRMVWFFLLAALLSAAACLASGAALATCTPSLAGISPGNGDVACYIKVQPVDVCVNGASPSGGPGCAPFNTTSTTGVWTTAGMPPQTISAPAGSHIPAMIPNNPMSQNPIGFTVDPTTGLSPPTTSTNPYTAPGVDVTRVLLNNIGVELVWFPMTQDILLSGSTLTTLNVTQVTTNVATCSGTIAGFTLTITKACSLLTGIPSGTPLVAVTDGLSGTGITTGTVVTGMITGTGGAGSTYTVNPSQTVSKAITITTTTTTLTSTDFQTLSEQLPSTAKPPVSPSCSISQMTIPPNSTINGVPNNCGSPVSPRNTDAGTINMFFVKTLNPPVSGGTLYGISWIGNNGIAISQNTFFAPTPLQARPDTMAHELLHDLGLDHTTYGAGPWVPPTNPNANPALSSYSVPFGVAPPIPTNPLFGVCDSSYPACGANLMTAGNLRNEPSVSCVLAPLLSGSVTPPAGCLPPANALTAQSPGFYTGMTDQVTPLNPNLGYGVATSLQLPMSQQQQVLMGMSGLLSPNPPLMFSGLINPIPYETTQAQLGTGGSATDRAIFDLPGPTGGNPGETLVAWVLTLPQGKTFARHDPFHVVSQSREDLVQDVKYYPDADNNPLMKNIAYYSDLDNNSDNPSAGYDPCAFATAECLMVKFRSPGLGPHDSISFSKSIVKSILFSKGLLSRGGALITNDDLCEAKITYMFSDGFATTSNFGRCPPASLPLISSSWRPDPTVAPQIIKINKSNVLLASDDSGGAEVMGTAYQTSTNVTTAVNTGLASLTPIATFTVPSSACTGTFTTLCFNDQSEANPNANGTLGVFLGTGGATNITYENGGTSSTALSNGAGATSTSPLPSGVLFDLTGTTMLTNGTTYSITHDDGMTLYIDGNSFLSEPAPTSAEPPLGVTSGAWTGTTGTHSFELVYGECCGLPAVLGTSLPLASPIASLPGTPDPTNPSQLLFDLGCTDCDATKEGGQTGSTCNNGPISGTIHGNVTVSVGQSCSFTNCEITAGLTINGGSATLQNCKVDGGLAEIAGLLSLTGNSVVNGGAQISLASTYNIGPGATINGGLKIQNTVNTQLGTVCGTLVNGGVTVQNNGTAQIPSPIQIGETNGQTNCPGNTIKGGLQCMGNNPVPTSGMNSVTGPNQCSG